jgi:hypothetical protein
LMSLFVQNGLPFGQGVVRSCVPACEGRRVVASGRAWLAPCVSTACVAGRLFMERNVVLSAACRAAVGVGVIGFLAAPAGAQPMVQRLGVRMADWRLADAADVVIGSLAGQQPVRLSIVKGTPVVEMLELPDGIAGAHVRAVSADGTAALFWGAKASLPSFRWDMDATPGGATSLFHVPEGATSYRVSAMGADGTCYGWAAFEGDEGWIFRWPRAEEPEALPRPDGFTFALGPMLDMTGRVHGLATPDGTSYSFFRIEGGAVTVLTPLPNVQLQGLSADGSTLVGSRFIGPTHMLYTWTEGAGFEDIMTFNLMETPQVQVWGISPDGSAIFGIEVDRRFGGQPLAWERGVGRTTVAAYLEARGVELAGWTNLYINQISSDGRRILAEGDPPDGVQESVLITLPAACAGDFNGDGELGSQDFFDFLGAFFASGPGADFNRDGVVGSQDFFDFLSAFFAGCG